jgi:uncharacterized heparinase superfamily protein
VVGKYFHTIRHLKPAQVYGRLYKPRPRIARSPAASLRLQTGEWAPTIPRSDPQTGPDRFRLLNEEREIRSWNDEDIPKLWLYNLHYFDHPSAELMERWVRENPVGFATGWQPYPLAIRAVNWMKWSLAGGSLNGLLYASLALQIEYLSRSIEFHLGANHLLADSIALTMAGMFFEGRAAEQWLATGVKLLRREIAEQILPDGGHYERSPMYHALALEGLLDLINVSNACNPGLDSDRALWSVTASRMLGWLQLMTHPDGRIAFFNDAAFGIAPEIGALEDYAERLSVKTAPLKLAESGYIRLMNGDTVVLFDAAPIGPDHQPGHAHADTLSFELSHYGRRVLVNSGTSTYERSMERQCQRGTAAHNTLRVDGEDQSEVWSSFRVAKRARPFAVRTDASSFAEAAHDGYRRLSKPVVHFRRLDLSQRELLIHDRIEGHGTHQVEIFFHFHPEAGIPIVLDQKLTGSAIRSHWYPEFNLSVPNETIVASWTGSCPVEFVTAVQLQ